MHKGFYYGDYSYGLKKKKRDNDIRKYYSKQSNLKKLKYFGLPFQIYSATSGYTLKQQIRNYI